MKAKTFLATVIVLLCASAAMAGWIIQETTTSPEGDRTRETLFFQGNIFKSQITQEAFIADLNQGIIYLVNPRRRVFCSGTPDEIRRGSEQASKQMMEEHLRQMPPREREAFKQDMKRMEEEGRQAARSRGAAPEIRDTRQKSTIAGYEGRKYEVWVDGNLAEELWISNKINVSDEVDLDKLERFFGSMSGPKDAQAVESSPEYKNLVREGYALKSTQYLPEGKVVTQAVKVEHKTLPASELKVPKGYRQIRVEDFVKGQMREQSPPPQTR